MSDRGICPKCGSNDIAKEVVSGCKTGDYQCIACGKVDLPKFFHEAAEKNTGVQDINGEMIFVEDIVELNGNKFYVNKSENGTWILSCPNRKDKFVPLKSYEHKIKKLGTKDDFIEEFI